jgi:predicted DCC family thiol-disulfide oxidoreductase YuxK
MSDAAASLDMPDGLMLFDGVCVFCSRTVRIVAAMDSEGMIRFTAMQSPYGRTLCTRLGIDADNPSSFVFFDRGRPLEATDAIAAMLARMPRPWRWMRIFAITPRPWRDAAYRWLARHRYRLFGRRQTCMLPDAKLSARFVETATEIE